LALGACIFLSVKWGEIKNDEKTGMKKMMFVHTYF